VPLDGRTRRLASIPLILPGRHTRQHTPMASLVPAISGRIVQPPYNRPPLTWPNGCTFGSDVRGFDGRDIAYEARKATRFANFAMFARPGLDPVARSVGLVGLIKPDPREPTFAMFATFA
jgi:hypothetical protein